MERLYYFYKTTNLLNGHYYYGVRSHTNPEKDPYLGSGVRLKEAIQKYGRENFKKEIQAYFPSMEKAYEYEAKIVTRNLVLDPNCYNVQLGGDGGTLGSKFYIHPETGKLVKILPEFTQEYLDAGYVPWKRPHSEETRRKMSEAHKGMPGRMAGKHHTEEARRKISESAKGRKHTEEWKQMMHDRFVGKPRDPELMKRIVATKKAKGIKMSEEARQKMSEAHKGKPAWNRGKKATTQNLYWVNDKQINRRVSEEERDRLISEGWSSGKIKKAQNLFIMD